MLTPDEFMSDEKVAALIKLRLQHLETKPIPDHIHMALTTPGGIDTLSEEDLKFVADNPAAMQLMLKRTELHLRYQQYEVMDTVYLAAASDGDSSDPDAFTIDFLDGKVTLMVQPVEADDGDSFDTWLTLKVNAAELMGWSFALVSKDSGKVLIEGEPNADGEVLPDDVIMGALSTQNLDLLVKAPK